MLIKIKSLGKATNHIIAIYLKYVTNSSYSENVKLLNHLPAELETTKPYAKVVIEYMRKLGTIIEIVGEIIPNKQKIARSRNWLKYKISGITIKHDESYITTQEQRNLNQIEDLLTTLKANFDENTKRLGIPINLRCSCGRLVSRKGYTDEQGRPCCVRHRADK